MIALSPTRSSRLIGPDGQPLRVPRLPSSLPALSGRRPISATYDAARTTTDFENYWANADAYDSDSANSKAVRSTLVRRSRYEIGNNGFADGIAQTYATDLIGSGPKLRMKSGSSGFNALVEFAFAQWAKRVQFRRKLWCLAHAKLQDGEGFGVLKTNPNLRSPVKLDWKLFETEQVSTPNLAWDDSENAIDGITFDEFGNVVSYDILKRHPGSMSARASEADRIDARFVQHWFTLRRPNQHRAIPELASTLNVGAASRRWREATIASAESAADFSVLLHTTLAPDELEDVDSLSVLDIEKRMMTALPRGYGASQMKAEHPNATFETFHKSQINEQARPKSMPTNKAMCDSSKYNFASGRLDHLGYYATLDVERLDCVDLVLDPIFDVWFDEAVLVFEWLGGNPDAIGEVARSHEWAWPKHQVADANADANATKTNFDSGAIGLIDHLRSADVDFEARVREEAIAFGVTEDQVREFYRNKYFNAQNVQASMLQVEQSGAGGTDVVDE